MFKRRLFFCVVALLAGIYTAYFVPDAISVAPLFFCLLIFFVSLFFTKRGRFPFFLVLFFLLGAFRMHFANAIERQTLYPYLEEYVTIYADAIEEPVLDEEDGCYTVIARVRSISFLDKEEKLAETVRLTVKQGEPVPRFGESFTAICKFSLPKEAMNSGGFNFARHLRAENIYFGGMVESGTVCILGNFSLSLTERLYQINRACSEVISEQLPQDAAAVLQAMTLGDQRHMSEELRDKLQRSGLSHVTAVSGMHVTILVSFLYVLFAVFERNKYKYIWLTGGVILAFMLFTGAGPSVVRAAVLGLLTLLSYLLFRRPDPLTSLSVAAGMLVLYNPFIAFYNGFTLSFVATLGIFLFAGPVYRALFCLFRLEGKTGWVYRFYKGILSILSATFSAQLALVPVASWTLGNISLWSFITTLLIAPLTPVLLVCGLLIGFLGLLHPVLAVLPAGFSYPFIKLFLWIVYGFGNLRMGLIPLKAFSTFGLFLYILALITLSFLLRRKWRQGLVAAVPLWALCCFWLVFTNLSGETATISFINVGQGDCTLLELPQDVDILLDGGGMPDYRGSYDIGKQVVLPYLQKAGVRDLEYMIASHPHEDHIRGLDSLLSYISVETLLVPPAFDRTGAGRALLEKAAEQGVEIRVFEAGDSVSFSENCELLALMPEADWAETAENENDASLVVFFRFYDTTALFTGDIESEAEEKLVQQALPGKNAQLVKAAHHGSNSSTSEMFLQWAKPQFVYIPCGKNSFGHPHQAVLERLKAHGVTVYRADEDKDVTFVLDEEGIQAIRKGGNIYDED